VNTKEIKLNLAVQNCEKAVVIKLLSQIADTVAQLLLKSQSWLADAMLLSYACAWLSLCVSACPE